MSFTYFIMTKYKFKFCLPHFYVENIDSVHIYSEIMSHFEIRIKDVYELDNFTETLKSSNTYKLPTHVFFKILLNIFYDLICKY